MKKEAGAEAELNLCSWVFRLCLSPAAGGFCTLLWWWFWSFLFYRFGSAATAKQEQYGFSQDTQMCYQRWRQRAATRCRARATEAERPCSISTSVAVSELLTSTKQSKGMKTANEECPVAQINSTTSKIIHFLSSFLGKFCWIITKIPTFFSLRLWNFDGLFLASVIHEVGKPGVFWLLSYPIINPSLINLFRFMEDPEMDNDHESWCAVYREKLRNLVLQWPAYILYYLL